MAYQLTGKALKLHSAVALLYKQGYLEDAQALADKQAPELEALIFGPEGSDFLSFVASNPASFDIDAPIDYVLTAKGQALAQEN